LDVYRVDDFYEGVSRFIDEASGDSSLVEARTRALSAIASVRAVEKIATWTPNMVLDAISDPIEAAAQIQAGPALHVVEAFAHACNSAQVDAETLRTELRRAAASWPS
jgi:hypothetical protein